MIKVGILGSESDEGGELLRILVNHPDVVLSRIVGERHIGSPVQDVHYGLIGETEARFVSSADFKSLDAVFVCKSGGDGTEAEVLFKSPDSYPDLRIIDLTRSAHKAEDEFVYGLSEIYRKPLVRGARRAFLPYPEESATLISLFPLTVHLLLGDDISIEIESPEGRIPQERLAKSAAHVATHIRKVQKSFCKEITMTAKTGSHRDALRIRMTLPMKMSLEQILPLYENIYDDHNFTFMVRKGVDDREVSGTNKCIIALSKPDEDHLNIETVVDGNMRGGVGEAVHVFNLLFGLHERTGLALKANYDHN